MATDLTTNEEELYATAEELAGFNALSLRAMALAAYEKRKDKEAMKVFSFVWGRNARSMAEAADYFSMGDENFHCSTDEMLSFFVICSVKGTRREELYNAWHDYSLTYAQVRERVAALKQPKEKKPKQDKDAALKEAREIMKYVAYEMGDDGDSYKKATSITHRWLVNYDK